MYGSIYEGHNNTVIYRNIREIVRDLTTRRCFPDKSYLGRLPFAGIQCLNRAAIAVDPDTLDRTRNQILEYALEHDYDPDELLRVLFFCSINAASNGVFEFESEVCQKAFEILRALPVSVRSSVLQGRYKSVRLFSAV